MVIAFINSLVIVNRIPSACFRIYGYCHILHITCYMYAISSMCTQVMCARVQCKGMQTFHLRTVHRGPFILRTIYLHAIHLGRGINGTYQLGDAQLGDDSATINSAPYQLSNDQLGDKQSMINWASVPINVPIYLLINFLIVCQTL